MIKMRNLAAMVAVGLLVGPPAEAFTITLDNPNQTVVRPGSGITEVSFFGTVTFASGEAFASVNSNGPLLLNGDTTKSLGAGLFCPGLPNPVCVTGGSGKLFSYFVASNSALGTYDLKAPGVNAFFQWRISSPAFPGVSIPFDTPFSIKVEGSDVPLPAAAWLLLSGLGGLGMVGRRRKAA